MNELPFGSNDEDEAVVHAFLVADLHYANWPHKSVRRPRGLANRTVAEAGVLAVPGMPDGYVAYLLPHGSIVLRWDPKWAEKWEDHGYGLG